MTNGPHWLSAGPAARFSRNARRPSWPSALVRCSAISCAVSSARERRARELLRGAGGLGPRGEELADDLLDRRVEVVRDLVDEADAQRDVGREALAGHEERRAALVPIFASANGEMTAGTIPSFTSLNANCAAGSATTMSQQATSPHAAAERMTLHARDDRGGAAVDRVEHRAQAQRVGDVLVEREIDRRAHPLDVGARRERRAVAREDDGARVADVGERVGRARRSARRRTRCAVRAAPS